MLDKFFESQYESNKEVMNWEMKSHNTLTSLIGVFIILTIVGYY